MMENAKYGITQGLRQWRTAFVVYIIQLLLAMTLGMQLYQVFEASIGDSLELNKLLTSYDHTVISDLLNVHGGSITPIIGQARWVLLAYMIFSVFINAGLMYTVYHHYTSWKEFWKGGATYFFKYFKLALLFLICYLLLFVVAGIAAGSVFGKIQAYSSEKVAFLWLSIILLITLVTMMKLFSASTYSKLAIIEGQSIWSAFISGWRTFRKRWIPTWGVILPLILIQVVIYVIYLCIEGASGMTSAASILIFFLIQQAIIFFRSVWKLMIYNGLWKVYSEESMED
jgi:hypothetical protein